MRKRRVAHVSDDDDDEPRRLEDSDAGGDRRSKRKKKLRVDEEEEEEEEEEDGGRSRNSKKGARGRRSRGGAEEQYEEEEEDEGEQQAEHQEDAKPIGDVIKVSGKGKKKMVFFSSFEYDGNVFELEDPVLLTPEDNTTKPYVAIIKEMSQDTNGSLWVTGQWFYRPEEAEKRGGGRWEARDTRELFYSFHRDVVPAESVMHKCVVHFIPLNKKLPLRQQHPGFIVQNVYDTVERKLWKLTDKDYEDSKQHEIDLLVQKTRQRLGELVDIDPEETPIDHADELVSKRTLRKKGVNPIDVLRSDDAIKAEYQMKAETPGSCTADDSEYKTILAKFKALTCDAYRDRWLEKLLQGIQSQCSPKDAALTVDKKINGIVNSEKNMNGNSETISEGTKGNKTDAGENIYWPDTAVWVVTSLERAAHEALSSDFQKYNQKMRQLNFNLMNSTSVLVRRLLKKELDPVAVVVMSPQELKDGFMTQEKSPKEPEESKQIQMTDARCSRCTEKKVGVADIIQAGGHGDRYQLECIACGNTWYASRDAISSLTINTSVAGNVGTAPWATAKFDAVEKSLVSPRDPKPTSDLLQKSTVAYMPVLETQRSFNRIKTEDVSGSAPNRE